ncbi:AMP-binding protein [Vibrio sp. 10N.261.46.E12]|uniref:AMP-binding protein n=1 Tax=unclassified Vibrio TaxID=2614977 RepID=UPI000975D98F|nr:MULTISPECIES: AMP-binding protein [unclassified Vibrio]OMO37765.1 AMP-fatty acid ligase [Vibrio sp. 10N.261.45.E1]PMJ35338.1 AMP-fatty acid ligase [Vibrio sp. 10N.286.45.B6]PML83652.1 AMP-fatty acid ligase [Vibrio sp. 10N.261.49.E11]PMM74814.1 AMP-fatty acid ligase [Vibrio sp. 10N.261.46.F12]PMM79532.1 AMP-fatty acid ligase [Vibrio sp. 10N.261.46.E8]
MTQNVSYTSLSELLSQDRAPESIVCFDDNSEITWQTFNDDLSQLVQLLSLSPFQRVAICTQDSYLFAVAFLASAAANKHIILPGNYQPCALAELSEHFDCLLVDNSIDEVEVSDVSNIQTLLDSNTEAQKPLTNNLTTIDLAAVQLTLFTSGSSGTPKAIDKTLEHLDIETAQLNRNWGELLKGNRIQSTVSHQHIYGLLFRILWPLCSGVPFARNNLEYPEQILSHANQNCVLISSPALLKRLKHETTPAQLAGVFSSGGPLPTESAHQSLSLLGHLPIEVFGSTETGGIAFRQQQSAQTPWQLFDCIEASLNSENCIKLLSPYIDENNWYQTADECEMVSNSQFILKGRTDRVIKIEEKRVSLVEVEKRLEQLRWISECVVIPLEEPERLILASVLVLSDEGKTKLSTISKGKFWLMLRSELRNWLEPIAIPRKYRVVDEIPLNSQGKRLTSHIEQIVKS